ncbi:MAG: hypothetical protein AAF559_01070 [Pseudomonadota bacterium]
MSDWDRGFWTGNGYGSLQGALGASYGQSVSNSGTGTGGSSGGGASNREAGPELFLLPVYAALGYLFYTVYPEITATYSPGLAAEHHLGVTLAAGVLFLGFSCYPPILVANLSALLFYLIYDGTSAIPVNTLAIALTFGVVGFSQSVTSGYLERKERKKSVYARIGKASVYAEGPTLIWLIVLAGLAVAVSYWLVTILAPSTLVVPAPILALICLASFCVAFVGWIIRPLARVYRVLTEPIFRIPPNGARFAFVGGALTLFLLPELLANKLPFADFLSAAYSCASSDSQSQISPGQPALPGNWVIVYLPALLAPLAALPGLRVVCGFVTKWALAAFFVFILIGPIAWRMTMCENSGEAPDSQLSAAMHNAPLAGAPGQAAF